MNAQIDNWNELRSAYMVAKLGTLSEAAATLGIHHSTVLRQINALEGKLQARLFHRHARGYAVTDAGRLLLQTMSTTEEQFQDLATRISSAHRSISGRLVVTAVPGFAPLIIPILTEYQAKYPDVQLEFAADARLLDLELGEAHLGIRAGPEPLEPDNVVQHLVSAKATLFATQTYIDTHGPLTSLDAIDGHRFISTLRRNERISTIKWLFDTVPDEQVVFRASEFEAIAIAARAGIGIAPLPCWAASHHEDLVAMILPPPQWMADLWLVTHVDLHRTEKVQSCLAHIKAKVAELRPMITGEMVRQPELGRAASART